MRLRMLFMVIAAIVADSSSDVKRGTRQLFTVNVEEPVLGEIERTFYIYVPKIYNASFPVPTIVHFHGQGVSPPLLGDDDTPHYDELAEQYPGGFVMVYPVGMGDGNCGVGWNVLDQNRSLDETCTSTAWETGGTCCYESCKRSKKCHSDGQPGYCGWSTCHDDVLFVKTLLTRLHQLISVDSLFAAG